MSQSISEKKRIKWKDLIEKQCQSGLPIRKWCLQNAVNPHTFCYWKAKFSSKSLGKSSFIELKPKSFEAISLRARGLYIRLESSCDPHLRKQLLTFIGEISC
jgi:hypothetical protein